MKGVQHAVTFSRAGAEAVILTSCMGRMPTTDKVAGSLPRGEEWGAGACACPCRLFYAAYTVTCGRTARAERTRGVRAAHPGSGSGLWPQQCGASTRELRKHTWRRLTPAPSRPSQGLFAAAAAAAAVCRQRKGPRHSSSQCRRPHAAAPAICGHARAVGFRQRGESRGDCGEEPAGGRVAGCRRRRSGCCTGRCSH